MTAAPPRFARWLIERVAPAQAEGLVGDLDEEFQHRSETGGLHGARSWYWQQVRGSIAPLLALRLAGQARPMARALLVGALGYVAYLVALYSLLHALGEPGLGPLTRLDPALFLFLWVFDASLVGAFLALIALGSGDRRSRSTVVCAIGVAASALLVFGIDESLGAAHVLLLTAVTFGGAWAGAALSTLSWKPGTPGLR